MSNLSELDLQNLRHLIGGYETTQSKMTEYASQAQDPQVKQFFTKSAQSAGQSRQQLMQFLNQEVRSMIEKIMVVDTLTGINGELVRYAEMIPQTENKELKQTLKQMRNQCEMSQEEIYQIAREKQYYVPASKATEEEVQHVKSILTQPTQM